MSKTVFVLGAGASKDLDNHFPTGAELAAEIQQTLTDQKTRYWQNRADIGPLLQALLATGLGDPEWKALERIRTGIVTAESIDEFIDEYSEMARLADIGKLAIVQCILQAEARSVWNQAVDPALVLQNLRDTWLGRILRFQNRRMDVRRRDYVAAMEGVVFVTFNYDRLLEKTLWEHLTTALGVPPDEAVEFLTSTPVIHVYGSAGRLDCLGGKQPYATTTNLRHPASQIRTFTETIDSITGAAIASHVASADTLCFLGFGFNARNLEVLFPDGLSNLTKPDAPRIFATTSGIGQKQLNELRQQLSSPYKTSNLRPVYAGDLLREIHDDLF
nr:SIR2 family protein [uncultured Brevundimonas sp.]